MLVYRGFATQTLIAQISLFMSHPCLYQLRVHVRFHIFFLWSSFDKTKSPNRNPDVTAEISAVRVSLLT